MSSLSKTMAIFMALIITVSHSLAAEPTLEEARIKVDRSYEQLLMLSSDAGQDIENNADKNLRAAKNVIRDAINLSLREVISLKNDVNNLPKFQPKSREKELRDSFIEELGTYTSFYNLKAKELNKADSLNDIHAIAKEMITYRELSYDPQINRLLEFLLIFYNDDVINTTESRLERISADIKKLERLGFIKIDSFIEDLEEAEKLIDNARNLRSQAEIFVFDPSLRIETEFNADTGEESIIKLHEPKKIIEDSLNKIKGVYSIFLKISQNIRKTLGLK